MSEVRIAHWTDHRRYLCIIMICKNSRNHPQTQRVFVKLINHTSTEKYEYNIIKSCIYITFACTVWGVIIIIFFGDFVGIVRINYASASLNSDLSTKCTRIRIRSCFCCQSIDPLTIYSHRYCSSMFMLCVLIEPAATSSSDTEGGDTRSGCWFLIFAVIFVRNCHQQQQQQRNLR